MRNRLMIFAMVLVTLAMTLPADLLAQGRQGRGRGRSESSRLWRGNDDARHGRRRYRHRNRNTYGYRNYGQYRRTQVGNRRYRMARRYYWRDGVRLSRYVRVYY